MRGEKQNDCESNNKARKKKNSGREREIWKKEHKRESQRKSKQRKGSLSPRTEALRNWGVCVCDKWCITMLDVAEEK